MPLDRVLDFGAAAKPEATVSDNCFLPRGEIGEELTAETFGKVMDVFIAERLQNAELPRWLRLSGGNSIVPEPVLLERTKAGLLLNLEYLESEKWHKLSIDLVPTLVLDHEQREKYLQVIILIVIKT